MVRYSENTIGTITMVQNRNGEARKFEIQIREGNCLAVFLHVYKNEHPADPAKPWVHQFINFLSDTQHLRNIIKRQKKDVFAWMISADSIESVKLNLFYKESNTLLKYMVKDGLTVECFYKECGDEENSVI